MKLIQIYLKLVQTYIKLVQAYLKLGWICFFSGWKFSWCFHDWRPKEIHQCNEESLNQKTLEGSAKTFLEASGHCLRCHHQQKVWHDHHGIHWIEHGNISCNLFFNRKYKIYFDNIVVNTVVRSITYYVTKDWTW